MKILILACVISALACSPVFADNLFLEGGVGLFKSLNSEVLLLRYDHDTSQLFHHPSYWEAVGAWWNGEAGNHAFGIARSVVWNVREDRAFDTTVGFVKVDHTTDLVGTHFQFYFRFAYDMNFGRRQVSLALIHISNGKLIFGWDGPNSGENFVTLSIGVF